jgi:hypothetical protein
MNPTTPPPAEAGMSLQSPPSQNAADDELDFADIKLGPRQDDAHAGIVCEGGCE